MQHQLRTNRPLSEVLAERKRLVKARVLAQCSGCGSYWTPKLPPRYIIVHPRDERRPPAVGAAGERIAWKCNDDCCGGDGMAVYVDWPNTRVSSLDIRHWIRSICEHGNKHFYCSAECRSLPVHAGENARQCGCVRGMTAPPPTPVRESSDEDEAFWSADEEFPNAGDNDAGDTRSSAVRERHPRALDPVPGGEDGPSEADAQCATSH